MPVDCLRRRDFRGVILAGIREKMAHNDIPEAFQGMPIVLVTAGLMAIAFCGFSGLL